MAVDTNGARGHYHHQKYEREKNTKNRQYQIQNIKSKINHPKYQTKKIPNIKPCPAILAAVLEVAGGGGGDWGEEKKEDKHLEK